LIAIDECYNARNRSAIERCE